MSRTGGATPCVTTRARRLLARVARRRGSAVASSAVTDAVDDRARGPLHPNSAIDLDRRRPSTNRPKSKPGTPATATPPARMSVVRIAVTTSSLVCIGLPLSVQRPPVSGDRLTGCMECTFPSWWRGRAEPQPGPQVERPQQREDERPWRRRGAAHAGPAREGGQGQRTPLTPLAEWW